MTYLRSSKETKIVEISPLWKNLHDCRKGFLTNFQFFGFQGSKFGNLWISMIDNKFACLRKHFFFSKNIQNRFNKGGWARVQIIF